MLGFADFLKSKIRKYKLSDIKDNYYSITMYHCDVLLSKDTEIYNADVDVHSISTKRFEQMVSELIKLFTEKSCDTIMKMYDGFGHDDYTEKDSNDYTLRVCNPDYYANYALHKRGYTLNDAEMSKDKLKSILKTIFTEDFKGNENGVIFTSVYKNFMGKYVDKFEVHCFGHNADVMKILKKYIVNEQGYKEEKKGKLLLLKNAELIA